MKLIYHPEARSEERDAVNWYRQESLELADRFRVELRSVLRRVALAPLQFPAIDKAQRKALLEVFPYAVIFTVTSTNIHLLAVAHTKRRPRYWEHRSHVAPS